MWKIGSIISYSFFTYYTIMSAITNSNTPIWDIYIHITAYVVATVCYFYGMDSSIWFRRVFSFIVTIQAIFLSIFLISLLYISENFANDIIFNTSVFSFSVVIMIYGFTKFKPIHIPINKFLLMIPCLSYFILVVCMHVPYEKQIIPVYAVAFYVISISLLLYFKKKYYYWITLLIFFIIILFLSIYFAICIMSSALPEGVLRAALLLANCYLVFKIFVSRKELTTPNR